MEYQNGALVHDPTKLARKAILAWLRKMSGQKFEEFVVQFLTLMGASRVERTGGAGDGGIDGTGLIGGFPFAFQAKQWDRPVPPKEVVNLVGALTNGGFNNGYFVTSSRYTPSARERADKARGITVELYDGDRIADTMIKKGFGVREVKRPVYEFDPTWWESRLNSDDGGGRDGPGETIKSRIWKLCDEGRHPKEIADIAEANGWNRKSVSGAI